MLKVPLRSGKHTFAKLAATAALALGAVAGVAAVAPAPAMAAGTTYTSFCFKHTNGAAWGGRPVYAQQYYNGQIYEIGSTTTSNNGCAAFWMPNYAVVRVRAYLRLANSVFAGYTNWAVTYGGSLNLGTAWVNSPTGW